MAVGDHGRGTGSVGKEARLAASCYADGVPRRLSTAKLLDRICAAAVELTKDRRYGGTQWVMVSQVEDHIGVSGTEVQRAILLGAETGQLHFAGVPAHSIAVTWTRQATNNAAHYGSRTPWGKQHNFGLARSADRSCQISRSGS